MKECLVKIVTSPMVRTGAWDFLKVLITAGLTILGLDSVSGCSSLAPTSKSQTMSVVGIGLPAIAIVTNSTQNEDASGGDENVAAQANPVDVGGTN